MVLWLSTLTILTSALLFSWIQPLAAKIVLPNYGGVPMVWNTCMVFFQLMILLGYLYSHYIGKYLTLRQQLFIHIPLALFCFLSLPILWQQPPIPTTINPAFSLLFEMIIKLGFPVFICATTSPLVQYWFTHSKHQHAHDPYFLFAASNVGALFALFSFPFLLEPWFGLQKQSWLWSYLFIGYLSLLTLTGLALPKASINITETSQPIAWQRKLYWLAMSMLPSSLFLAVTQQLTLDLPTIPFLWLIPLIIYFLSFVITFARRPIIPHDFMKRRFPFFLIFPVFIICAAHNKYSVLITLTAHCIGLFAVCLLCHGELVATRPQGKDLTRFYCWMAFGGFLGGVFSTFIAPQLFNDIYEYPLELLACTLLWPAPRAWNDIKRNDIIDVVIIVSLVAICTNNYYNLTFDSFSDYVPWIIVSILAYLMFCKQPLVLTITIASIFCFGYLSSQYNIDKTLLLKERNFFGVKRVVHRNSENSNSLLNGSTMHGIQQVGSKGFDTKLSSYYLPSSHVANILETHLVHPNVGIIGLGTGTMACQFPSSKVTLFEIDPAVINIAENTNYFTYLSDCPNHTIVKGDARLELQDQPDHYFDALFFDAFSSDSIPVHLVTEEAMQLYRKKITRNGALVFHISQRNLDLLPVMRANAKALKMEASTILFGPQSNQQNSSQWVVISSNQQLLNQLNNQYMWYPLELDEKSQPWTDDYANLFSIVVW